MNEWLTVMTSSPAVTPATRSARCSAVVQFETAQACGAPTKAANSRSNAATSGPWVSQPEVSGPRTASISAWPRVGRAIGISCRSAVMMLGNERRLSLLPPPGDEAIEAVLEPHQRLEAQFVLRAPRVGEPPRHWIDLARRRVLDRQPRAHRLE